MKVRVRVRKQSEGWSVFRADSLFLANTLEVELRQEFDTFHMDDTTCIVLEEFLKVRDILVERRHGLLDLQLSYQTLAVEHFLRRVRGVV